jgi:hypothetical protein
VQHLLRRERQLAQSIKLTSSADGRMATEAESVSAAGHERLLSGGRQPKSEGPAIPSHAMVRIAATRQGFPAARSAWP